MDIYALLKIIVPSKTVRLNASYFNEESYNQLSNEDDRNTFSLLKRLASVSARYEEGKTIFSPAFELQDGRRIFSLQDLTEDDYKLLNSLKYEDLPDIIKMRVADILWSEKRNYKMALQSAKICHDMYRNLLDTSEWVDCYNFIAHSVRLLTEINSKEELAAYLKPESVKLESIILLARETCVTSASNFPKYVSCREKGRKNASPRRKTILPIQLRQLSGCKS